MCIRDSSREDLLGMNVREITSAEDADKMIGNLSTKGRSENKNFETRIKLKNGEEADMHWTANWSPKQQSYFCVVHDISAEKQIERMKKEFVAMVSHDLRTPLNSVLNLLTLMSVEAYGAVNETGHKRLDLSLIHIKSLSTVRQEPESRRWLSASPTP